MNPLILYSSIGALALGMATGWSIRDWKADSDSLGAVIKAEKAREKLQSQYDELSLGYEADRSQAAVNSITRQTELRTIYRDVPIRNDCAAPDSVRSLLKDSVSEANTRATGKPVDPLPEIDESSQPTG